MKKTTNFSYTTTFWKKFWIGLLLALLLLILSGASFGQNRWQATVRAGANFPTKKLAVIELNTGVGIEGTIAYRFMPFRKQERLHISHFNIN